MIDVTRSRELQANIYAIRLARRDIRLGINKRTRARIRPLWQRELSARARGKRAHRVIVTGARATATDRGVRLMAATSRRPLRGGLVPADEWAGDEFGARTRRIQVRQRSRAGRPYVRPLTINRQFPARSQSGRIAYDAASTTGTQIVREWVDETVTTLSNIDGAEVVSS